jgi:Holliday junction resolvase RusA-like endonuclease
MKIIIPGKPIAKKRPRFARRGKFVTTYNDQETEEGKVLWEIRQQRKDKRFKGPLFIDIWFGMPIPKNTPKKRLQAILDGKEPHIKKPDLDNLIKFYLDVMNQEVFEDDKQIYSIWATKGYADNPRTEIRINEFRRK